MFDAIIHVGDFAYDMYENNGERGDLFMEQIEPIASTVPYMTCPGNLFYFMEVYCTYDPSYPAVGWSIGLSEFHYRGISIGELISGKPEARLPSTSSYYISCKYLRKP